MFITAGVDFIPIKNVHFMPKVWYNHYPNKKSATTGANNHDYDRCID
ncbi:MAG: hypothetical protein M3040_00855 [Bacteroidota bacterium]|nr:hypothetical protein [Bacteroidota bacterium]